MEWWTKVKEHQIASKPTFSGRTKPTPQHSPFLPHSYRKITVRQMDPQWANLRHLQRLRNWEGENRIKINRTLNSMKWMISPRTITAFTADRRTRQIKRYSKWRPNLVISLTRIKNHLSLCTILRLHHKMVDKHSISTKERWNELLKWTKLDSAGWSNLGSTRNIRIWAFEPSLTTT